MKDGSTKNTKKVVKINGTGPSVKKASKKGSIASKTQQEAETSQEVLHLRKKKNADRRYVKWLGFIFDDSLDFDIVRDTG